MQSSARQPQQNGAVGLASSVQPCSSIAVALALESISESLHGRPWHRCPAGQTEGEGFLRSGNTSHLCC